MRERALLRFTFRWRSKNRAVTDEVKPLFGVG